MPEPVCIANSVNCQPKSVRLADRRFDFGNRVFRFKVPGEIARFSLKCEVNPSEWNPGTGRATGKSAAAQKLNGLPDNFRASLTQHYREISDREAAVTAEKVRNAFLGLQMRNDSLLDL
ncbi:MAG: hypothetical protein LBC43_00340, partial [Bifidobacteriaceae bacterium]|nr:hypothetical protein [Bifidobacteriaceae bacterium]